LGELIGSIFINLVALGAGLIPAIRESGKPVLTIPGKRKLRRNKRRID